MLRAAYPEYRQGTHTYMYCTIPRSFHDSFTHPYYMLSALISLLEITSTWLPIPFMVSYSLCKLDMMLYLNTLKLKLALSQEFSELHLNLHCIVFCIILHHSLKLNEFELC